MNNPAKILDNPELFSVLVTLEPLDEMLNQDNSGIKGYQAYAAFLNLLRSSDCNYAESLHNVNGAKPFTLSYNVDRARGRQGISSYKGGKETYLRVTFLNGEAFARFLDGTVKWGKQPLEIGDCRFRLGEIITVTGKEPLVAFQTYHDILESAQAERNIRLDFMTPTAFRSGGKRNVLFPEPQLIFGSYLNRWQAFSPVSISDSISSCFEWLIVARYRLRTQILDFGSYQEVGFTGECHFELDRNVSEEAAIILNALADFALYCGSGAKTTMGMGQTRRLRDAGSLSGRAGGYYQKEG